MQDHAGELWPIIWLSLQVSGLAVAMGSVIGVRLGAWIGLSHFRGKRTVAALVHTGMALPPVVVGLLVYLVLSRSGPLAFLGWLFTPWAMILAQTILALPFVVGITMTAVSSVPPPFNYALSAQVRGRHGGRCFGKPALAWSWRSLPLW